VEETRRKEYRIKSKDKRISHSTSFGEGWGEEEKCLLRGS